MEESGPLSPNENRAVGQLTIVNPHEDRAAEQLTILNPNKNRAAEQPTIAKVKLGIRSQDGTELYYRLPCDKKLKTLFMKYCENKNVEYGTLAFPYDGRYVRSTKTAAELGLADGDIIDAMMRQYGGGLSGGEVSGF